jgi:hypothetical protein
MRKALAFIFCLSWVALALGQDAPGKRYGIDADLKGFPQGTAKEALTSVVKAIDAKRIDYLLAQLADPQWVDDRVEGNGGSFKELVEEAKAKLVDDPGPLKKLRKLLSEGEWKTVEATAIVHLKEATDQAVFFKKTAGRWYMENRKK